MLIDCFYCFYQSHQLHQLYQLYQLHQLHQLHQADQTPTSESQSCTCEYLGPYQIFWLRIMIKLGLNAYPLEKFEHT